ncbi:MAG: ATPase, T2SS/T4P/T4SS family [Acidimicrobiales bacterium]|nr:ATPase, T2SS/T4P/T4SS family [Acidimicrobiales bacterium]
MTDPRVVEEIHLSVGEQLSDQARRAERAEDDVLDEGSRRQLALALIRTALQAEDKTRLGSATLGLTEAEEDEIERAVMNRLFGLAKIQDYLDDPENSDITIYGHDTVWLTRRDGSKVRGDPVGASDAELRTIMQAAARRGSLTEKTWDAASPDLDLQLPSGDRLHALGWVTQRPAISIRRHNFELHRLKQLMPETISPSLHEFLRAAVRAKLNVIVAGETGAGKTTLLRCLLNEIGPEERLVTIEDSLELGMARFAGLHPDLIEAEAREPNSEGVGEYSMARLVRQTLRMNPDRVVVGEIRGHEVTPMLLAMSQGNDGSMSTVHADSSQSVFSRIAMYTAMSPEAFGAETTALMVSNAVHIVVQLARLRTGERVVSSVREVVGADGGLVVSNEVYAPDPTRRGVPATMITESTMRRLEAADFDPTWHHASRGGWG